MDEKRVKTPKELMNTLEMYSVPVKDIKGKIDYYMVSATLYNEIAWGLYRLQKRLDNQEKERMIANGQSESTDRSAGRTAGSAEQAAGNP